MKRLTSLSAVAMAATLVLAACGSESDGGADGAAESLRVALDLDMSIKDPQMVNDLPNLWINGNVNENLFKPDFSGETQEAVPSLATGWETNGEESWTVTLQEGVEFTNGEPFNAEAAKYSIDRFVDPATGTGHAGFVRVASVEVVDDYTIAIETDGPFPDLIRSLYTVAMVPPELVQDDPESFKEKPVGTGPYMIEDGATPDRLTLTKNPDYWNADNVEFVADEVVLNYIPETASRVAALQAGEVDVATRIPLESAESVPATETTPATENLSLRLNSENGVFTDPRMREAVQIGTDVEAIRQSLYTDESSGSAYCQFATPQVFGFNPELETPPVDVERARQLIAEAGMEGAEVTIVGAEGRYPKGNEVVQAVAAQWTDLGLDAQVEIVPDDAWLAAVLGEETDGEYVHEGHDAIILDVSAFNLTAIEPLTTALTQGGVDTFPHDEFPEARELLEQASTELDPAEQESILQELAEVVCSAHGTLFIGNLNVIWGVAEGVDIAPQPGGRVRLAEDK